MSLTPGTRLGVYEIIAAIGEGGMGQVFRARDTKLDRDVAIKILPEALAHDADRLARFTREAKTLASLNHPQIAGIYGLEESGGMTALVMELVEGEDLSQRVVRGAIPVDEALPIAKQIAEALEAAHEQGIIHRDLKPANIKVRTDGTVKVLDFGLAKVMEPTAASSPNLSMSPTITSPAMTQAGIILGTAAYMSPEQARGKVVDRRADIWAFGCVLYEMLTGTRAFAGDDVSEVLASVLAREPDWTRLPRSLTPGLTSYLKRCLQRDPRQRVQAIGDVRLALEGGFETAASSATSSARGSRERIAWIAASATVLTAIVLAGAAALRSSPEALTHGRLIQVEARVGGDAALNADLGPAVALSPDGSSIAFVAQRPAEGRHLYTRRLDQLAAAELPGTDGALTPFFSADGQFIAFFAAGKLKKIPVTGGGAVTLCDAPNGRGGTWSEDGTIYFTPNNIGGESRLYRVSAAGGNPVPVGALANGEATQRWPQALPGGKAVIYSTSTNISNFSDGQISVRSLPDGSTKTLIQGAMFGRYLRSGHLTFVRDGRLFAAPFDLGRLEISGDAVPVLENVSRSIATGAAQFDMSNTGVVAYLSDGGHSGIPLQWLSRDGTVRPFALPPRDWSNPRFSPDGQRVAMDVFDGKQTDIWIYEWAREALTRLTFDPAEYWQPVWTPDGTRIAFRSTNTESPSRLLWQRADGSSAAERLTDTTNPEAPSSWDPTGRVLAFVSTHAGSDTDIMTLRVGGGSNPSPEPPATFLSTPAAEHSPAFSPDGRWIAYVSNEHGRDGVYVRPYPGPGGRWLVAPEGTDPTWSRSRHELVFMGPDQRLMVSAYVADGSTFRAQPPSPWSSARAVPRPRGHFGRPGRAFDLHPDGERAVGAWVADSQTAAAPIGLVLAFNFFDELNRITPAKR